MQQPEKEQRDRKRERDGYILICIREYGTKMLMGLEWLEWFVL